MNCKWVFTLWQWYYNKTTHKYTYHTEEQHTKLHKQWRTCYRQWIQCKRRRRKEIYPFYRPWRPIGLSDVEAITSPEHSIHSCWLGCQPCSLATFNPPQMHLLKYRVVLISVRGRVSSGAMVLLKGLGILNLIQLPYWESYSWPSSL
jgi:hypothetical protein